MIQLCYQILYEDLGKRCYKMSVGEKIKKQLITTSSKRKLNMI